MCRTTSSSGKSGISRKPTWPGPQEWRRGLAGRSGTSVFPGMKRLLPIRHAERRETVNHEKLLWHYLSRPGTASVRETGGGNGLSNPHRFQGIESQRSKAGDRPERMAGLSDVLGLPQLL